MRYPRLASALLATCVALASPSPLSAMSDITATTTANATPETTGPLAEALAELRKAIDTRLAAIEAGTEVPNRFDWTALDGQFTNLATNLPSLSAQDAKNRLRNLGANLKSTEAKEHLARLSTAVDAAKAEEERAKLAAFDTRLAEISKATLAATTPSDLDPLYTQLEDFESDLNQLSHNPRQQRLRNALNRQQNFLNQWQTLLEAAADGNQNSIRNAANNLNNGYSRAYGVDRSAVRERIQALQGEALSPSSENDPLREASLENLAEIKTRLVAANEGHGWNIGSNQRMQLIAAIDQIQTATLALEAGDIDHALALLSGFSAVHFSGGLQSSGYVQLQRLRAHWLASALPALTSQDGFAPLQANDTPSTYLERLHAAADSSSDWPRAAALARIQRSLRLPVIGNQTTPADPLAAYQALFAGQRLETAGQNAAAAEQYRAALIADPRPKLAAYLTAKLLAVAPAATP